METTADFFYCPKESDARAKFAAAAEAAEKASEYGGWLSPFFAKVEAYFSKN